MNARQERGVALANQSNLVKRGETWLVPSSTEQDKYRVHSTDEYASWNCPDFELRGETCKHIFAVRYTIEQTSKLETDGSQTVTETVQFTKTMRRTYN